MADENARHRKAAPPAVVKLVTSATDGAPTYTIDLEGGRETLRIHSKGATAADLTELSRAL